MSKIVNRAVTVFGKTVDSQTRCVHYHSPLDIIAIRFKCCGKYYPCYQCHNETEPHPIVTWPEDEWEQKAILCGVCQSELGIREYMSTAACPVCRSPFNPGCSTHYHLYFSTGQAAARNG